MWTAFLYIVLAGGASLYQTATMEELGEANTQAACERFVQEFRNANPEPIEGVDHYRIGCIQE